MTQTSNPYKLQVKCPFYDSFTEATLTFNENGKMVSLTGPYNEVYAKTSDINPPTIDINSIVGEYVNVEYAQADMNDWHYVTISIVDPTTGVYRWSNRAGVEWTMTRTSDSFKLSVGTDSPYYNSGYTEASLTTDANGQVTAITGAYSEWYAKTSNNKLAGNAFIGGPAPSLKSGSCANTSCSECREYYLEADPKTLFY